MSLTKVGPPIRMYVYQPISTTLPQDLFLIVLSHLDFKEWLPLSVTCRQLHEWIWKTSHPSLGFAQECILWNKCSRSIRNTSIVSSSLLKPSDEPNQHAKQQLMNLQDIHQPQCVSFTGAGKSINLFSVLNQLEKKARREYQGIDHIIQSGHIHLTSGAIEADAKSTAQKMQATYTITHKGLITVWKHLPTQKVSEKDVLHHVKILSSHNFRYFSWISQVIQINHLFFINIRWNLPEKTCCMASRDLSKYSGEKQDFHSVHAKDELEKDRLLANYSEHQHCWQGHSPDVLYIANNAQKVPWLASFYFNREQGILIRKWQISLIDHDEIEFNTTLLSNDEVIVVPVNGVLHQEIDDLSDPFDKVPAQILVVLDAKTGKTLYRHLVTFKQAHTTWDNSRWLFGKIIAYQLLGSKYLKIFTCYGKIIPPVEIQGQVTQVTREVLFSRQQELWQVKEKNRIKYEIKEKLTEVLKITFSFQQKTARMLNIQQLTLQSNQPSPSSFIHRMKVLPAIFFQ